MSSAANAQTVGDDEVRTPFCLHLDLFWEFWEGYRQQAGLG